MHEAHVLDERFFVAGALFLVRKNRLVLVIALLPRVMRRNRAFLPRFSNFRRRFRDSGCEIVGFQQFPQILGQEFVGLGVLG